jgi:uncharacterized C2H2 Zn-finger protein
MLADGLQHLPMSPVSSLDSSDTDNAPSEQINDQAADEWRYAANDFAVRNTGSSTENPKTTNDLFTVSEFPIENAVGVTDESSPAAKIEMGQGSHNRIATPLDEVSCAVSSLDRFDLMLFFQDIYQDSSRRYGCVKCKKTFGRRQEAKRHVTNSLSCGGTRAFRCHKCKRLFTRQDALARHVKGSDGIPPACKNPRGL